MRVPFLLSSNWGTCKSCRHGVRQTTSCYYREFADQPYSPSLLDAGNHDVKHRSKIWSFKIFLPAVTLGSALGFLCWPGLSSDYDSCSFNKSPSSSSNHSTIVQSVRDCFSRFPFWKISPDCSSKFLFGEAYRRRIFFKYEKRLRLRSPPEKIFEYFASFKAPDGELLMKPVDLMRAIIPIFPPSESNIVRDGYLRGERRPGELHCSPSEFFMLFDINNDGLISFQEYIFFATLLSIPESSFTVAFKMFDINNNGEIDRSEFKKVMALMREHSRQGAIHRDGRRTGLKVKGSVENGGLLEHFFGKDGKACLQHDKFVMFMRDFHDEIMRLEFAHYDCKLRGSISAKDFALSIVASAEMNSIDKLLDRVDKLNDKEHLRDMRITFQEFKNFGELRKMLLPFSLALFSFGNVNGLLTKADVIRAAYQVCGIPLTENVVDILFHLFDWNGDGKLSLQEFLRVLQNRERDIAQPVKTSTRPGEAFSCLTY